MQASKMLNSFYYASSLYGGQFQLLKSSCFCGVFCLKVIATGFPGGFVGTSLKAQAPARRQQMNTVVVASGGKKVDVNKQGLNSVKDETVRLNLMGKSKSMESKDWVDSQGRKGKGYGVYRFANKYGVNVDGYSPIYTPDTWSESGDSYKLGTKGLIAWAGLIVVLLGVGINLVISTSAIGQ